MLRLLSETKSMQTNSPASPLEHHSPASSSLQEGHGLPPSTRATCRMARQQYTKAWTKCLLQAPLLKALFRKRQTHASRLLLQMQRRQMHTRSIR